MRPTTAPVAPPVELRADSAARPDRRPGCHCAPGLPCVCSTDDPWPDPSELLALTGGAR